MRQAEPGQAEQAEQSRARYPDESGYVDRAGVRLWCEVYGEGPTTVLMLPTWSIVHSRIWKLQIPFLARHFRVVTFDGRGIGRSDRPEGPAAYADAEFVADTVGVMDATGTDRAVLVALSAGCQWAVELAAWHPDRVAGLFAIAPSVPLEVDQPHREAYAWHRRHATTEGWAKYNRHYWLEGDFADFRQFFFDQLFPEAHSTKQIEDALAWSADLSPQTLVDATAGRAGIGGAAPPPPFEPLCAQVRCPVSVVHGTDDHIRPAALGERLAELTRGSFTLLEGAGHGPMARDPVRINTMIRDFVDTVGPAQPRRRTWRRAATQPKRVLYISSPIGLGHARRDLAIVQELRTRHPDVSVDWLAQAPVTTVLAAAGERVHPASAFLASESAHVEAESGEHDLHVFSALRRMDEILVHNYMVFDELVREERYDLVVGDEAWDVDHFLHENPERKQFPFAWMTDFVGYLPMPDGGPREAALTTDYNAEMIEHRARFRHVRDTSIFVGNPDDIVPGTFGPGLPGIREWTEANFDFAGYVTGFEPPGDELTAALRSALGYRPEDRVCVVTVGGSGVGAPLLRRVLDAVPLARRLVPELRFLVVCGPRIDPASLPRRRGVRVRGYLPHLHEHLAAADVAVVQGGLTTCMELAAARTPFLYVPLEHHFEQAFHVRHRLERYAAGRHVSWAEAADPDFLAEAIVKEMVTESVARPVETGGAARAAGMLSELL
jgi:pimeloyl-ACP methyl ester carboxylesterase/predicted glycosyltransferase